MEEEDRYWLTTLRQFPMETLTPCVHTVMGMEGVVVDADERGWFCWETEEVLYEDKETWENCIRCNFDRPGGVDAGLRFVSHATKGRHAFDRVVPGLDRGMVGRHWDGDTTDMDRWHLARAVNNIVERG